MVDQATSRILLTARTIFGGVIGAIVDHNSGAAYQYPTLIQVLMGQSIEIRPTPPAEQTPTQQTDLR